MIRRGGRSRLALIEVAAGQVNVAFVKSKSNGTRLLIELRKQMTVFELEIT
jgi:hypothetical protein